MATPGTSRPILSRRSNGVLPIVDSRFLAWVRTGSGTRAAAIVYWFGLARGGAGCRIHWAIIANSVEIRGLCIIVRDCAFRRLATFIVRSKPMDLCASYSFSYGRFPVRPCAEHQAWPRGCDTARWRGGFRVLTNKSHGADSKWLASSRGRFVWSFPLGGQRPGGNGGEWGPGSSRESFPPNKPNRIKSFIFMIPTLFRTPPAGPVLREFSEMSINAFYSRWG